MPAEAPVILRVAVAGPLPSLFDYLPSPEVDPGRLCPGTRILVPFGRGRRVGLIVERTTQSEQAAERLKPIDAVLDARPLLGPRDIALARWAAAYYQHPPGDVLFSALPVRLRRPEPLLEDGEPGWRLTSEGRVHALAGLGRAPAQRRVAELLLGSDQGLSTAELKERLGACGPALRALAARGWAEPSSIESRDRVWGRPASTVEGPTLNRHQQAAVGAVRAALGHFRAFLLEGVTGSGKTEVYIRLLHEVLAQGQQGLVLVPEIGLTPQLQRRLNGRLSAPMVTLHSSMGERERELAWRRAAGGEAAVVVGTRSAVFVPLPRLGLILVDEEHDLSFKQQEGFRYSARDLAVRRAQQTGCPVVLGSATPSLESLHNATSGRYGHLELPERAGDAMSPQIALLDIRSQPLRAGLSPVLVRLLGEQVAAGNQVLLFLNRRGFAPVLICHACGWVGECPRCDARLTLHLAANRLWCHHCGLVRPVPTRCPGCGTPELRPLGQGTERLEGELRTLFPGVSMARVDRDSTRRKGALGRVLTAAREGEVQLLLGTQMLAKGHHFPGVTLVGILDVDQGLYGADFRSPERMAQLVIQVAGRAGRAERPGRVVLQTRHPDHPLLLTLQRQGYGAFARAALEERREAALPPFAHQALLRAESREPTEAIDFLAAAAEAARDLRDAEVQLFGPVPAPMERRAGRHRAHLLAQSAGRPALQRFLADWVIAIRGLKGSRGLRWSLDVDPQELL
jgi:primosomal protein N' (replication factor Y)